LFDIFIYKNKEIMKKIIRLTESDLTRIVRRVIKESNKGLLQEGVGQTAFDTIKKAMDGLGTDENMVAKGVYMIKTKPDYQECLTLVNKAGYKTILAWIATDMSWQNSYDKSQSADVADWGGNNKYLKDFQRHLRQFNPNETIIT
jgi:hypothetical protein